MATLETGAIYGSEMKPDLHWKKIYVHVSEISFWAKELIKTTFLSSLSGEKKISPRKSSVSVVESVLPGNQRCFSVNFIDIPVKRCVDSKDTQGPRISTCAAT